MRKLLLSLFILLNSFFGFAQTADPLVDSLENILVTSSDPKKVIDAKASLVKIYYNAGNKDKSMQLYRKTLKDAAMINYQAGTAALFNSYGNILYYNAKFDSAMYYFEKSLVIKEKVNDKIGVIKALNNIGSIYYALEDYKKGLEYLEKASKKEAEAGIEEGTYVSINNIGYIYARLKLYKKSFYYFRKAEKVNLKTNDKASLVYTYDGMASSYESIGNIDSALIYAVKCLNLSREINDVYSVAYSLNSIAILCIQKKQHAKALEYLKQTLEENEKIADQRLEMSVYGNMAISYMGINEPEEAYKYALKVIELEKRFNIKADKLAISGMLAEFFAKKKDFENAYKYLTESNGYRDSLYNKDITNELAEMQSKYDIERKEQQNALLQKENDLKNTEIEGHKTTRNYLIGIIALFVIVIFGAYYFYQKIKAYSTLLGMQKNSIEQKNHLLEEQKKEITDSINYAKRIQYSLLAHDELLLSNIPDHFVLFKPKDIVSGDFYWAATHQDKFYLAVCDSTGHGVPGAFMSLLNIGFLNEAIKEKNITDPNKVFDYVRKRLVESISRDNQKDGMDGILICIDKKSNMITYAAAHNAPVIISDRLLMELEKDKMPVGKGEMEQEFKLFTLNFKKGDILYLYTDGYADQFGGPKGKKLKYKPLNDLILRNSNLPMLQQSEILSAEFEQWKGNLEQIDDVAIIGIRL